MVLYCAALYHNVSYVILLYPIPLHSIVRYCVVAFGAQAVSCKTPIYFMLSIVNCIYMNIYIAIALLAFARRLSLARRLSTFWKQFEFDENDPLLRHCGGVGG